MTRTSIHTSLPRFALLGLCLSFAAGAAIAQDLQLQPAQPGDLVASGIVAAERAVQANATREPVAWFQALPADQPPLASGHTPSGESREYWQRIDAGELNAGYDLALTAPGAVVMVSPSARSAALRRDQIQILHRGRTLSADQATDTLVDADDLRATGMSANEGSVGFRLHPGLEDSATLRITEARGEYVLHVFEPQSPHALTMGLATDTVHAGAPIQADLAVSGDRPIEHATALLVAPDGRHQELSVAAGTIRAHAPAEVTAQPGLWEVRTSIAASDDGVAFQRDLRVPLAVVAPTARLDGSVRSHNRRGDGALSIDFGIEVATAGRYELRGILYGTDTKGASRPVGIAHVATWLDVGSGTLNLAFPLDAIGTLAAPYELRDLRLSDQSAVALLERRERALVID